MKKIFALLIITIFGVASVVSAAELDVSVNVTESGNDTVELITQYDDLDLKWISAYVEDENGIPVWIGEKRPTQSEQLEFYFTSDDTKTRKYKATVSFVGKNDEITRLEKEFTYYSYAEVQQAISDALSETKTLEEVKEVLSLQFNELYEAIDNNSLIISEMNAILAGDSDITHEEFLEAFDKALVKAALKNKNADTVKYIIENYSSILGITDDLTEKKWYAAISDKSNIISRIAENTYEDENAFLQSFRRNVFLEKVSKEHSSTLVAFLRQYNGLYYTSDGKLFTLDFDNFDTTLTTNAKKEYAGVLLTSYDKSTLEALEKSFNKAIDEADDYTPSTGGSSGSGGSTGGGSSSGFSYSVPVTDKTSNNNSEQGFTDLDEASWARTEIEWCAEKGIVNGKTSTAFCPNDLITREEFTAIIVRAFNITADGDADFADVDKNAWYYDSIRAAYRNGIVNGQGEVFGIGSNITRQDMAVIMYRTAMNNGINLEAKSDRELYDLQTASDYAREAIDTLYKASYINGMEEGIYAPMENATRAQAVKLIYSLINR